MRRYTQHTIRLLIDYEIKRLDNELEKVTSLDLEQLFAVVVSIILVFTPMIYGGGLHLNNVYLTNNTTVYIPLNSIFPIRIEPVNNDTIIEYTSCNITSHVLNIDWDSNKHDQHRLELQFSYPSQIQYFTINSGGLYLLFVLAIFEFISLGMGLLIVGRSMSGNKKIPVGIAGTVYFLSVLVILVNITYIIVYIIYSPGKIPRSLNWWGYIEDELLFATLSITGTGILGIVLSRMLETIEGTREPSKRSRIVGILLSLIGMSILVFIGYEMVWPLPQRFLLKFLYLIGIVAFGILLFNIMLKYYNRVKIANMIRDLQNELINIEQHLLMEPADLSLTRKPAIYSEKMLKMLEIIQFKIEDSQKDRDILEQAIFYLKQS